MRRKSDFVSREVFTNPGNCRKPTYSPKYADDGSLQLVSTGFVDTDAEISSRRNQTDMSYILSRLTAGDPSVAPDPNALYGDVTGLPDSPIGMVNFLDDLHRQFDSLPAETRALFDNNFNRFIAGIPLVQDSSVPDKDKSPVLEKDIPSDTIQPVVDPKE